MQHVLSASQWARAELESLFLDADRIRRAPPAELSALLRGRLVASLFYQPSTRTRLSFEIAALRLGALTVSTENAEQFSSAAKGETLEDTVRVLEGYGVDAIVLRHPEEGAAARAAAALNRTCLINAGDGPGEHPTQALLDLYAIRNEIGTLDRLHVAFVGDLRYGRTVHSLARLLLRFRRPRMTFVAPGPEVGLPPALRAELAAAGAEVAESDSIGDVLGDARVFYVTRLQREHFPDGELYPELAERYSVTPAQLAAMRPDAVVLHPLPRTAELPMECDGDPRAAWFRQAAGGLFVRMALLLKLIGQEGFIGQEG
jgi:aspartate carbamoyltransferase catalytic subunit